MHFADFLTLLSITVLSKYVNINTCRKHVTMLGTIVNYSSQGQKDVINSFILILFHNDSPSKITFISMEFIQNFLSIGLDKNVMYQKFTNEKYETYHIYRNCRKAIAYYVLSFSTG